MKKSKEKVVIKEDNLKTLKIIEDKYKYLLEQKNNSVKQVEKYSKDLQEAKEQCLRLEGALSILDTLFREFREKKE